MKRFTRLSLCLLIALLPAVILAQAGTPALAHAAAKSLAHTGFNKDRPAAPPAQTDWGSVNVGTDGNGRWFAQLENSQIRVRYAYFSDGTSNETVIRDFVIKSVNEDQAGSYFIDATSNRGVMTSASVIYDGADRKTVHLEWDNGGKIQEVSIFPDSLYIRIDYIKYGVNIVDVGSPGGATNGTYSFYGAGGWIRGYVLYEDSYYNRYPGDGINDPANAGSLNYNGFFIGGIYRSSNGRGYGRVMPIGTTDIIKLLFNQGFEWYACFNRSHQAYTAYLFAVTGGGEAEVLSTGQQIADQAGQTSYTLTTNVSGSGSVTKNPNKLNYNPGEVVTLTATANTGWVFNNWSGSTSGSANPKTITMNGNKNVTANFTQNTYTLSTNVNGSGSVAKNPSQPSYTTGQVVTLTATASPGWTFVNWSGDLTGSANPATVTMNGNRSVTANFTQTGYVLTVNFNGSGTVVKNPNQSSYSPGQVVTLTATPNAGWTFNSWSGDLTGGANPKTVTMNADKTVTANFDESGGGGWWDETRRYRVPIVVQANGFERFGKLAERDLNFTQLLTALGGSGALDENSIRVVEVTALGSVLNEAVTFQFDKAAGYNATTNALGTLVFRLTGTTPANATRYYDVYFDTTNHGPYTPLSFTPLLTATNNITDEGQLSIRVQTQVGTYFYHKQGAGFSSLNDVEGIDWIGYHPSGGSAGEYRGVPNINDYVHPGAVQGTSSIVSQGPLKAVISSNVITGTQNWQLLWEMYPTYARMTLLQKGTDTYWFLYEGTPYGALNVGRDFFMRSGAVTKTYVAGPSVNSFNADIPGPEWVYFGDDNTPRVLFMVQHEDNNLTDSFWQLQNNMTVFGYGRPFSCCEQVLTVTPAHFTMGFADNAAGAVSTIDSAYRALTVTQGLPQLLSHAPVLAAIGSKVITNGLALSFNVSASDVDGITPTLSADGLPGGATFTDQGNGTGHFSWTPAVTQTGVHTVTFTASDGALTDIETINVTVLNHAPTLNAIGNKSILSGGTLSFTVSAGDPDGSTPALSASGLPGGATFTDHGNGTGHFSWAPLAANAGVYTVTFQTTDGVLNDSEAVRITVSTPQYKTFLPFLTRLPAAAPSAAERGPQAVAWLLRQLSLAQPAGQFALKGN